MMAGLVLMPIMPNFWSLIVIYILFSMSVDIGSPLEPLAKEIVPPHQRGGATGRDAVDGKWGEPGFLLCGLGPFQ